MRTREEINKELDEAISKRGPLGNKTSPEMGQALVAYASLEVLLDIRELLTQHNSEQI